MDIFSKNKFLVRIIFILLFLNIISTGYLWFQKREKPDDRQPKKERENSMRALKDKLNLTREQEMAIVSLRQDFVQREESVTQMIKSQRDSMNVVMFHSDSDTSMLKRIAKRVADNEFQLELLRIEQAQKFKGICTPEQLREFQHLVINIRDILQPPNQPQIQPQNQPRNQPQNPPQNPPRKKKE
ncbi:MAG: Spy/CpxP family protein refolding chaperone [Prolixibacteraceae bacterium]|jgi:Spy/CpxP family protein refolding chaperone